MSSPVESNPETRAAALAEDPWLGFDIVTPDPALRDDPYPVLNRLRELDPVNQTPIGIWRVSRYDDVVHLLRNAPVGVRFSDGRAPGEEQNPDRPGNFMLVQDPPHHTRLRKLVSRAFTRNAVGRMRARAEEVAGECVDRILEQGDADLIAELALPVPATMICEMMGVPVADRDRFAEWTGGATHLLSGSATPEQRARGRSGADALAEYFGELIAERRESLRDDILSDLIRADEEGDRLRPRELIAQCVGLLIAGFETTIGLIGNGAKLLMDHPAELARLRADAGLLETAVDECLRLDGPITLTLRVTHEDVALGDSVIPKDSPVFALLAAANRDPRQFEDPERFDVGRTPNPHLAFGGGAHLCLGAHLARMEAQVALGELVRRTRQLELAGSPRHGQSLFRVFGELPVRAVAA